MEGMMKLFVSGRHVWVEGVPSDCSDADVGEVFAELAREGDEVAARAVAMVGHVWLDMKYPRDSKSRVYVDG